MNALTPRRGRTCTRCKRWKQAAAFRPNPKLRVGLSSWCRRCQVARTREWRADASVEIAARRRALFADPLVRDRDNARRRALYARQGGDISRATRPKNARRKTT